MVEHVYPAGDNVLAPPSVTLVVVPRLPVQYFLLVKDQEVLRTYSCKLYQPVSLQTVISSGILRHFLSLDLWLAAKDRKTDARSPRPGLCVNAGMGSGDREREREDTLILGEESEGGGCVWMPEEMLGLLYQLP